MKFIETINVKGELFDLYELKGQNKQMMSQSRKTGKKIKFGDPNMLEFPGTKRGNLYCTRTYGMGKKFNILGDTNSANFWSRWYLWNCDKKKSLNKRKNL